MYDVPRSLSNIQDEPGTNTTPLYDAPRELNKPTPLTKHKLYDTPRPTDKPVKVPGSISSKIKAFEQSNDNSNVVQNKLYYM